MTTEKRPKSKAWEQVRDGLEVVRNDPMTIAVSAWRRRNAFVISTLVTADMPDHNGAGEQWHVSVRIKGGRGVVDDELLAIVRTAFDMRDAEEDNHEPGKARHLWLVVEAARRVACECKADEVTLVEPDGHVWQSPPEEIEERRALMQAVTKAEARDG